MVSTTRNALAPRPYDRLCETVAALDGSVKLRRDQTALGLLVTLPAADGDEPRGAAFTVACVSELDIHAELCLAWIECRPSFVEARQKGGLP